MNFDKWLLEHRHLLSETEEWNRDDVETIFKLAQKECAKRCIDIMLDETSPDTIICYATNEIEKEFLND